MSAERGAKAVLAALLANLGIAVSKFVAFLVTGSSSLLAESVHSLADCGNQGLLLLGRRTAQRAADEAHPFGYGRDRYFYAFVVSVVLFTLGSLFALYEGIHKITKPEPLESAAVAIGVLLVAIVAESLSFRTAIKEANPIRGDRSWPGFIRHTTSPDLPVILLEDAAALLGLVFALVGVVLAELTGSPVWDGVGTLAIGVLLGLVAAVLAVEMKSLLIGESAPAGQVRAIRAALTGAEGITRVIHLRTMYLGPDELLVAAKIAMDEQMLFADVATSIDAAEELVRSAVPAARVMYLEPDVDRAPTENSGSAR
ncbi:MAG: cation diffusion facilitator family transporter [Mycobacteriales bacterium]